MQVSLLSAGAASAAPEADCNTHNTHTHLTNSHNPQNTATPTGGTSADAVLGVSVFAVMTSSKIKDSTPDASSPAPVMCMSNIFKNSAFKCVRAGVFVLCVWGRGGILLRPSHLPPAASRSCLICKPPASSQQPTANHNPNRRRYFKDGNDPSAPSYVPGRQPPDVFSPDNEGPPLYSGLWTHMYSGALHGTLSETELWIAGRAVGGAKCEFAGPTDSSTCVPAVWYAQIIAIEADVIFNPRIQNEDVIFNSLIGAAFPAVVINKNGSAAIQFAYSSNDDSETGIVADNGDLVVPYAGVCVLVRVSGGGLHVGSLCVEIIVC